MIRTRVLALEVTSNRRITSRLKKKGMLRKIKKKTELWKRLKQSFQKGNKIKSQNQPIIKTTFTEDLI